MGGGLILYNFSEDELEQAALEWFEEIGYEKLYGPEISPGGDYPEREDYSDVLLDERLKSALSRINKNLPQDAIDEAYRKIKIPQSPSLLMNNKEYQKMITDGIDVEYRTNEGEFRTEKVWLFDFNDDFNNDYAVVNQLTIIENGMDKRPDVVVYINGIPVAVFELKSTSNEDVGISEAYNQLQTYKKTIPSLFTYNSIMIISDGLNARAGTLTSDEERFMMWRTIEGDDVASPTIPQLEVLIKGIFDKRWLLDIIKHFILFQSDGEKTIKILAGYHQYHATNKAIDSTKRATSDQGDRKIGVVWHTQGSGKSLSMVFYTGKLVLDFNNPTIVIITDRNDLDDQLYATFSKSKDLLRQTPKQAEDRAHLKELLQVESGGIVFTTIHKFAPEEGKDFHPVLTDRKNVIVIADEAHRSQYGFGADVTSNKNNDEAGIKFGYAKYMRDSLPNASYIGFTGTPVELTDKNTPAVFGDYIDIYDMTRAVEDGTTVKIFYESRIAKIELSDEERPLIDETYDEITEYQENTQREKLKSKWSRLEALAGSEKRLKLIAKDFVAHFEKRQEAMFGKSMLVVMSRRIAIDLYKEIIALRPEWHSDDDDEGVIKIVMTGSSSDPEEWQPFIGNKRRREHLARRMKDNNDPLKIAIVRDMWLTGFDVPSMNTMYIDKPMKGHNLMQAIARVNRVFRDKPGGLIVDYIGIADSLKSALSQYTESDRKTAGVDTEVAVDIMLEKYDLIRDILHGHDYSKFKTGKATDRMQAIVETVDFILGHGEQLKKDFIKYVTEMAKAYALCTTEPEAERLNIELGFFKAVKSGLIKIITPENQKRKTVKQLDVQLNQLISKSIISEEVVDILSAVGLNKPNIAILSDEFLEEVKGLKQKNLAVELLNRLLNGKVKTVARRNYVQSKKFSEMLEQSIVKYNNRAIETTKIIEELIGLAKEMNDAFKRGEGTDMIEEEVAFYDALAANDTAVQVMGDVVLKQIARELSHSIKNNMNIDWSLRESVRAKMRVAVKRLLKKYGYPPDMQKLAIETVMKQAELMAGNEVSILTEDSTFYM
ncbi:type I restriction endonuclease subunit R [Gottfriedia acidiceleris]|uniref:Type I restriction enzyme endonuclease subunit n=1 Tax=Gottfriedia acidiceleris TaxID=371036 RepID=A0ABY4JL04_9BACI|nr:type I restriction endonuclease subunit R [Gottfriedia acidiceleris]UPM54525.1 type I restriction endonuclease subunit R [Gottfriedia acidiceleris]